MNNLAITQPAPRFSTGGKLHKQITDTGVVQRAIAQALESSSEVETQFVYAVGDINAKFPNLNLEKEFYQNSLSYGEKLPLLEQVNDEVSLDRLNENKQLYQQLFNGLSQPQNRYIARDMTWVLDNRFGEALYELQIDDDDLLTQCIAALGRNQNSHTHAPHHDNGQVVVIGETRQAGVVVVSAIMPVAVMPFGKVVEPGEQRNVNMTDLVDKITSLDASGGNTDALRALNYLIYNNPEAIQRSYRICYQPASDGPNPHGYNLINVEVDTFNSGERIVADIIFSFQGIDSGVFQYWYSRVDVTGEYPFEVVQWSQYLPTRLF